MVKTVSDILEENAKIYDSAKKRAGESGYRAEDIERAAYAYIGLAKDYDLNLMEFEASLKKASGLVCQSLSMMPVADATADAAKV